MEYELHYKATQSQFKTTTVVGQLVSGSKAWKQRLGDLEKYYSLENVNYLQTCDLTAAASHTIVFESLNFSTSDGIPIKDSGPKKAFEAILLQTLTRNLPSIAIQSHFINNTLSFLVIFIFYVVAKVEHLICYLFAIALCFYTLPSNFLCVSMQPP